MLWWVLPALAQDAEVETPAADPDPDDVEELVVTASRGESSDHPVAVEVVSREDIEASGAESLAEVLEEQSGVQIERTVTGTAVRLQGMNPEHTLILIDGQRVLGRKDGVIDLSRVSVDNIERIEIVKGPSSALYGSDAMGGVVHIITRDPTLDPELGFHVRAGGFQRVDATGDLSVGSELLKHRVAAGWHSSAAWDLDPEDVATTSSGYEEADADYSLRVDTSADSAIDLDVAYMQRRLHGIDAGATGAVFDRLQTVEDARVGLGGWVTPGPSTKLSLKLSGSWYRDQFISDQRLATDLDSFSDNVEQIGESTVQLDQSVGTHFLTVGVDGLAQYLRSDRLAEGTANRQRIAGFAQDLWTIGPEATRLQLSPGFRVDADTQFGAALTPRLATSLAVEPVTVRLGAGTGFRAPDFRELYLLFENPGVGYLVAGQSDLQPERSRNINGGVDLEVSTDVSVSTSAFFNDITDLINVGTSDIEPGALQIFGYENVDRAQTAGFEVQGQARPGPVDLELGYAYTWSRDLTLDRQLEGRVPHRGTGAVRVRLPEDLSARVQTGISSPRTFYEVEGGGIEQPVQTETLVTTDARLAWKWETFEVFAGVDNVFDSRGSALAPLMPRFVYVGFNQRSRWGSG